MQEFSFQLFPEEKVVICLLKNVENIREISNNVRENKLPFKCALIDARFVLDTFQVLVAANKAIASEKRGSLVTKQITTELIYNLSISTNISETLRRLGPNDETSSIVIVAFNLSLDSFQQDLISHFKGVLGSLEELASHADLTLVQKYYKLNPFEMKSPDSILSSVISQIATKDAL